MLKVKDVSRLKAFGYTYEGSTYFDTGFNNKYITDNEAEEHSHIFVNEKTGIVGISGDPMFELLDEVFELQAAGLLVRVKDDEKD